MVWTGTNRKSPALNGHCTFNSFQIAYLVKTMKAHSLILFGSFALFLAFAPTMGHSQSVLNGGFENVTDYPSQPAQLQFSAHWVNTGSASNAPDLFHVLGSAAGDLPETPIAMVNAFEGMAIAGFSPYSTLNQDRRQYISGRFSEPLTPGIRYQMTMRMTNGEVTAFSDAGLGISGLGMRFSESALQQVNDSFIDLNPHFVFSPVFYNREWQQISFNFVAQESWTHFAWGLFGSEPGSVTMEYGENATKVYCFVDGFALTTALVAGSDDGEPARGPQVKPHVTNIDFETDAAWFVPSAFTPNGDGDNDVFRPVVENVSIRSFQIYSRWGEVIYSGAGEDFIWNGESTSGAPVASGSYVWKMTLVDQLGKLTSKSGPLSLIR
jgi:gliding motility-associated-like protein